MASEKTFDFIAALNASPGESRNAMGGVQAFLRRFGYLSDPVLENAAENVFDDATSAALRQYQRAQGIPVTGLLDEGTVAEMSKPRCGFPDILPIDAYEVSGTKWPRTALSYSFDNYCADIGEGETRSAIVAALALWSAVTPLRFTELRSNGDFRISFVTGRHNDDYPFDGPGQVLAHAFFPPPNAGLLAGDAHFDESEQWQLALPIVGNRFDLVTVAAHEFGHSLGLRHSNIRGALMYPSYGGVQRHLHQDDIDGIRTLYGA